MITLRAITCRPRDNRRTKVSDAALHAGGFALAHALWSVSDLEDGLLVPLAVIEDGSTRRLLRFEAVTQQDAIEAGKRAMVTEMEANHIWAFGRDGIMREAGEPIDVISVDCWAPGMPNFATILQRYIPFNRHRRFRLLGDIEIVLERSSQPRDSIPELCAAVEAGMASHTEVAKLLPFWK